MTKKLVSGLILVFVIFTIVSLARNVYNLVQTGKQLEKTEKKIQGLKQDQGNLKKDLDRVESDQFIEEEARKKLNYVKGEEVVVILPKENTDQQQETLNKKPLSNWQKWLNLLFGEKEE